MSALERADVSGPGGTRIRRWERVPADATEAVVFVHGATYGGRSAFDPDGFSWLGAVASTGRAAYAPDVRGYGDSERPPELEMPAEQNPPVVRAATAARDVAAAMDTVRDRYEAIHLVGYSWGTIIAGLMVTEVGVDVASLVQYAPSYRPGEERRDYFSLGDSPAAFRTVTKADVRERWAAQRPENAVPDGAFTAFWETLSASGQGVRDTEIVAPNGTLVDLTAALDAPQYDAAAIEIPALVVRGSLDTSSTRSDALTLYDALGATDRTYTEIAGGTHFLQFESNRSVLYDTVRGFHERIGAEHCY
jgi:pimeloyl-ACP methyl ester carboxylesterase